jgi:FMN reductase
VSDPAPVHVVGFGGTRSPGSTTVVALEHVLVTARSLGATSELFDAGTLDIPMYDWGAKPTPEIERLARTFHAADALVWASPLYHGTVSGLFKNAVDWLEVLADASPPYLTDKPVGLIGVAGGAQALQAITSMEQIVRSLRGWAVPLVVPINRASDAFDRSAASVRDLRVAGQLDALAREVVRAGRMFRGARS